MTNARGACESRDSEFLVQNRTCFHSIQVSGTRKIWYQNAWHMIQVSGTRFWYQNLDGELGSCDAIGLRLLAKNCLPVFFLSLSHSAHPLLVFPLEFRTEVNHEETRVMGLSSSEDPMIVAWVVYCQRVTDRQRTDRVQRSASQAMLTRCKNGMHVTEMMNLAL